MRGIAKVDKNQPEIVETLRKIGATVQPLHAVGKGCPDILVGYRGINYLIEIKNPLSPKQRHALTPDQVKWHELWCGQVSKIFTADEAIAVITGEDNVQ